MDDLLREFLTETTEHLDVVDLELVRFEQDPNNEAILRNIFRLVHTVKGTCGFLGLPRLEALAHAAETLMGRFRDGLGVTSDAVTLILATLDRVKAILAELERSGAEPDGSDEDLIGDLERMTTAPDETFPVPERSTGRLVPQVLERTLKPGEVSLDDLERAFRDAPGPEVEDRPAPRALEPPAAAPAGTPARPASEKAAEAQDAPPAKGQTIRVAVDTIEHLMTMVSELVLTRNQLLEIARRGDDTAYKTPLQRLSHVTAELQDGVMKTRMQPIGQAWQKLPRVVRDLSAELGKSIDLVMQGAETELDRQVLDVIKDPLTHMVRNSADHGLESPAERRLLGKPERGTIRLSAYHEGGTITIEIADDGRGLDLGAIRRKVMERGLADLANLERMSDAQVAKFIFHPGFSTAAAVTAVSGRGVGMDVVQTNIESIGGTIDILSEPGRGATFTIKIPLTLAIVTALIVSAHGQRFAVPQGAVLEIVRVEAGSGHTIEHLDGSPVLRLRDRLLPIASLARVLGLGDATAADKGFVLVVQAGRQRFGVLVDGVFHTEEIVVKPMASRLRHIPFFSGNTILGDGAVVLIVDPNGVARTIDAGAGDRGAEDEAVGDLAPQEGATTLLVFRGEGPGLKAVPLSLVTRLETIDAEAIEWGGGRPLVQYRGRLMPLVPVDPDMVIGRAGRQSVVVFSEDERAMGLVVGEIVDIVEGTLAIDLVTDRCDCLGSAVVRGRATEIVNVAHYLPLAHPDWGQRRPQGASTARSVLLVDDSAFFREMLGPVLRAAGCRVAAVESAADALAHLSGGSAVDVVVTDLEMPGRDGFDLVEAMRADRRLAGLPVIALSSGVTADAVERARRLGIAEFVAKFDRAGLIAALDEALVPVGAAA